MRHPIVLLFLLVTTVAHASTTITYQGQLQDGGGPVDTSVDMTFELFDAASGGASVGGPLTENGVAVTDGLFQVELDFGEQAYVNGVWLAVEVEGDLLAPRQPIAGAPFAISAAPGWELSGADIHYSDGKVGIGTSSPDAALDVIGSAKFGVAHQTSGTYSFVGGGQANIASGAFGFVGGGSDNTASGSYSFVGGGLFNTASGTKSFAAGSRASAEHDGAFVWADGNSGSFSSTGEDQFLVRAGGGVGVNTSAPTRDLHIKQRSISNGEIGLQIERSGSSTNNWAFYIATSDNLGFRYNDNLVARIDTSGEFATLSDSRFKTDIMPLSGALDRLMQLQPASYRMTKDGVEDPVSVGLIAQQVSDVMPGAVSEQEGTLGVYYNQITALNTAGLIELNTRHLAVVEHWRNSLTAQQITIEAQETRIADSEQRLKRLEAENAALRQLAEHNDKLESRLAALEALLIEDRRIVKQPE